MATSASTRIEQFAREACGIKLTAEQMEIIQAVADGKLVMFHQPTSSPVRQVLSAWIKQGLREAPHGKDS